MTILSAPQQAELEKAVTRTAYFISFEFAGNTSRICSADRTLTWGGFDWLGFGQVLNISTFEESEGAQARSLTFTIGAQAAWLALAVGPVEEYRGHPVRVFMCPLDTGFNLIGTPALAWRGIMDTCVVGVDGDEGGVTLKCETSAYGLKRQPIFRVNAAQHKATYPNELGFDYLNDLLSNPQLWLSKKFQAR